MRKIETNTAEERYWNILNYARRGFTAGQYKEAMLVTALAVDRLKKAFSDMNDDAVFKAIEKASDDLMCHFSYESREEALRMFRILIENFDGDLEQVIQMLAKDRKLGIMSVPEPLFELYKNHFEADTETVLITEGEKFAPHLREMVDDFSGCEFTITTMESAFKVILEEIFKGYDNVEIVQTSIYEYEFINKKFDLIMAFPIFGTRKLADKGEAFTCREYEMVALENLLLHISPAGRLVILMPPKVTFAGGRVKTLRDFIMNMYCLEEMSDLPAGIFNWISIKGTLLVISSGITEDVIVKQYYDEDNQTDAPSRGVKSINIGNESFVMRDELEAQENWNIELIFAALDEDWQRYVDVRKEKLSDIAEVFRGKNVSRKEENGNIAVMNISNIKDHTIDYDDLEYIEESERRLVSYILKEGDVLVTARGTATRVAVFHEQDFPCIASSNINVIRPNQDLLDSTYLKVFLDSPLGLKLLQSAQQGAVILNLSYKDMQNLEIPLPEINKQRKISAEYKRELEIYTKTISEAEKHWRDVLTKLQDEI